MKICFICTANASRSPMAEALFRGYLQEQGRSDIEVTSAGVSQYALKGVSDIIEAAMCRHMGYDIHNRPRVHIQQVDTSSVDIFAVMEPYHADCLRQLGIDENRIYLYGGGICDPHLLTIKEHRRCRDQIIAAMGDLLGHIDRMV